MLKNTSSTNNTGKDKKSAASGSLQTEATPVPASTPITPPAATAESRTQQPPGVKGHSSPASKIKVRLPPVLFVPPTPRDSPVEEKRAFLPSRSEPSEGEISLTDAVEFETLRDPKKLPVLTPEPLKANPEPPNSRYLCCLKRKTSMSGRCPLQINLPRNL
jgi:hypothetical protein